MQRLGAVAATLIFCTFVLSCAGGVVPTSQGLSARDASVSDAPVLPDLTVDFLLPDGPRPDAPVPDSTVDAGVVDLAIDAPIPDSTVDAPVPDSTVDGTVDSGVVLNICASSCGDQAAPGCYCDDECSLYGDCCQDGSGSEGSSTTYLCQSCSTQLPTVCGGPTNICADHCGAQSALGCWCNALCAQWGDCCQGPDGSEGFDYSYVQAACGP